MQEQVDSSAIRKVIKAGTDVKAISTDAVSVLQDALVRFHDVATTNQRTARLLSELKLECQSIGMRTMRRRLRFYDLTFTCAAA